MTIVLILVSTIALIISGIGIMNIMLVTVTERTREIGLRMAVGASRHAVLEQFLTESIVISMAGGLLGILVGISIPLSVRFFTDAIRVPISIDIGVGGLRSFGGGGRGLRDAAGQSRFAAQSHRGLAIRMTLACDYAVKRHRDQQDCTRFRVWTV